MKASNLANLILGKFCRMMHASSVLRICNLGSWGSFTVSGIRCNSTLFAASNRNAAFSALANKKAVFGRKQVSVNTGSIKPRFDIWGIAAHAICSWIDWLKVMRVYTRCIPAKVINVFAVWNWANAEFVGYSVRVSILIATTKAKLSVTGFVFGRSPHPAWAKIRAVFRNASVLIYLVPKARELLRKSLAGQVGGSKFDLHAVNQLMVSCVSRLGLVISAGATLFLRPFAPGYQCNLG
jgi:hypothetical protein